ncbi:MAG: hypothetical protein RIT81_03445 [Deltaproteobacteria bacterium]
MKHPWGTANITKSAGVADAVNGIINELEALAIDGDLIKDRFHVGAIGYHGRGAESLLKIESSNSQQDLWPISALTQARVAYMRSNNISPFGYQHRWVEPKSYGGTPANYAFERALASLEPWVAEHRPSFPPLVFNITDGEFSPGHDPEVSVRRLQSLATDDGESLVLNVHISSTPEGDVVFPLSHDELPAGDDFAHRLFDLSSKLPVNVTEPAELRAGARGFAYNRPVSHLFKFLQIGTRVLSKRI